MKQLKKIACLTLISLFTFSSCDSDDDATNNVCENTYVSSIITNVFSSSNGYDDLPEFMDLETHEYRIKINANGEICSVGYQNPSTWTGDYIMEVINETSNTSYSGLHTFSQAQLDFQNITPVPVNSGDVIRVVRTINNSSALNETIGRILRKADYSNVPYPISQGSVEFLSSNFYGAGGPAQDFAQPYIPLGFKVY